MSISKLPSGRYRAQVYDPAVGRNVSVSSVLGGARSFATKREAKAAREQARQRLGEPRSTVTVAAFRDRWLTDPLFARPKQSTMIHNAERTRAFADRYGSLPISRVGDDVISEWLRGGSRNATVPALRAMFNDARSAKAGRLIDANPFAGLGIAKTRGNRGKQPASEQTVWELIGAARRVASPSFAGWLQVAAFTGMRPGELDALEWDDIDPAAEAIHVRRQHNQATRTLTAPKNGLERLAILTAPAREALDAAPRYGPVCFPSLRGAHWTASSRAYHWNAVRAAVGYTGTLYMATRHFAGWYMVNVLRLAPEDVAVALGHTDGGYLVRTLYGHLDEARALDRVRAAYAARPASGLRTAHETAHGGRNAA